jgi:L-ascorbate metabolism protein UlaG (beta-lactamase superfamily)
MKIKWLGHAAFLITSDSGTRIITDPYHTNDMTYGRIEETADIVTVSHDHGDHNNVEAVRGKPQVVRKTSEAKGIKFKGIPTYHDDVCHMGDLGHPLNDKQRTEIGKVDVLLIPVGGIFTLDAGGASQICDQLKPKVVMPMHYKTDKCGLSIKGVDEFVQGKNNVTRLDASEVELKPGELPTSTQIMVLKSAL